jgi:hypothetical protein
MSLNAESPYERLKRFHARGAAAGVAKRSPEAPTAYVTT